MKKTVFISVLAIILIGTFQSCINLSEEMFSEVPADGFFVDEESMMKNVGRAYSWLSSDSWSTGYLQHMGVWMHDITTTDECMIPYRETGLWWDNGIWIQDHRHTWDYTHDGVRATYFFVMDGVTRCNQILYQMEESEVDFEGKQKLVSEVKMIRAWLYLKGIDWFRNLPLVTDFKDTELPYQEKPEKLFSFIENEINLNKENLEDCPTSENYGRITKAAAFTMLAKLYLNSEVWTGKSRWNDASDACDSVMRYTSLVLEDDYFTNFCVTNETSKEIIWSIPLEGNITNTFPIHCISLYTLSQQTFGIKEFCWDGACGLEWLWRSYEEKDSRRDGTWLEGLQYDASGNPLMISEGRQVNYTPEVGPVYDQNNPTPLDAGVRMQKWEYIEGLEYGMSNDFPIYRLADIYLMKAECLMRMNAGNATSEAVDFANKVRERANATLYDETTLDLDELLKERSRELCWEGHRRQDQIRFGTFDDPWFEKDNTETYRNILPIPKMAMTTNSKLIQNEGYN